MSLNLTVCKPIASSTSVSALVRRHSSPTPSQSSRPRHSRPPLLTPVHYARLYTDPPPTPSSLPDGRLTLQHFRLFCLLVVAVLVAFTFSYPPGWWKCYHFSRSDFPKKMFLYLLRQCFCVIHRSSCDAVLHHCTSVLLFACGLVIVHVFFPHTIYSCFE